MTESKDTKVVALADGIDFNQPILDMNDNPIRSKDEDGNDEDLRLGNLCVNALMAPSDDGADGIQKLKRFNLAKKIQGSVNGDAFSTLRLNSKNKKTILDLAEKAYQTLMYARLYEALEGTTDNEDEE